MKKADMRILNQNWINPDGKVNFLERNFKFEIFFWFETSTEDSRSSFIRLCKQKKVISAKIFTLSEIFIFKIENCTFMNI